MKKQKISIYIKHQGEDYYGIEIDGKYKELSLSMGRALIALVKAIKEIAD